MRFASSKSIPCLRSVDEGCIDQFRAYSMSSQKMAYPVFLHAAVFLYENPQSCIDWQKDTKFVGAQKDLGRGELMPGTKCTCYTSSEGWLGGSLAEQSHLHFSRGKLGFSLALTCIMGVGGFTFVLTFPWDLATHATPLSWTQHDHRLLPGILVLTLALTWILFNLGRAKLSIKY